MTSKNIVFGIIAVLLVSGCTQYVQPEDQQVQNPDDSHLQVPTEPTDRDYPAPLHYPNVVDANNLFALDLYSKYKSKEGNIFFSPYSISSALAMTYEGAKGKTAEEMQAVLHLPNDKEKIRSDFSNINDELNKADKSYKLSVANALWAQKDFPFAGDYLTTVDKYYGGKTTNLDFVADTENSRKTINDWVENKTNDKIKDVIPEGALGPSTKLVLTNAIYFKANWSNQFNADNTRDGQFKLSSEEAKTVKMMHQTTQFNYGETSDLQILEMDYVGNDLSMLIILPKDGQLDKVQNSLNKERLDEWKKNMQTELVYVTLPKFTFKTKYLMATDLADMGMPIAFSRAADFSGMTGKQDLHISQVIHQTFIEVAEYGTEAAAATVVSMATSAMAGPQADIKIFNADHPVIFIIQQKATGNILFIGRMSDPSR